MSKKNSRRHEDTLPSKSAIFDYWKDKLHLKGILIDWCEPSCWACGWGWNGRYDVRSVKTDMNRIWRAWERAPLQRCHILAQSLGGSDEVSNLFLMCRECHDLAPNTANLEFFFLWASKQSWFTRSTAKIKAEMEILGVTEEYTDALEKVLRSSGFKKWLSSNVGIHFPQSGYATFMSRITASTILGALLKYIREHPEVGIHLRE